MRPNVARLVLGGFAGTLAMTAMMYFVAPMMGVRMDIAAMLGSMLGGSWTAGLLMHFANGALVFPLVYGYLLASRLPGSPALRGALWGVVLWLIAQTMVMPMMGAGLFSAAAGGLVAAAGSLVGHLLYGAIFGVVSGGASVQLAHA
jgi:uncharacterized membrane protein YagU involved in acid resistance